MTTNIYGYPSSMDALDGNCPCPLCANSRTPIKLDPGAAHVVAAVARRAAGLVSRAWTQGSFARVSGNGVVAYCLMGAINEAIRSILPPADAVIHGRVTGQVVAWCVARLSEGGQALITMTGAGLESWNDAPRRTSVEVVSLLEDVALLAEETARRGAGGYRGAKAAADAITRRLVAERDAAVERERELRQRAEYPPLLYSDYILTAMATAKATPPPAATAQVMDVIAQQAPTAELAGV